MPPSLGTFPVKGEVTTIDRSNVNEWNQSGGGDTDDSSHSSDLGWRIQVAGQMYQSIKVMRLQHEQNLPKKRLLRRRMRSLEGQNSWRKLHLSTSDTSSPPTVGVDTTMASLQLLQQHKPFKVVAAITDMEQQTTPKKTNLRRHSAIDNNSILQHLREESTVSHSEVIHCEYQQREQQDEELLQLCEEQQDLLERLLRHHQEEKRSWDRRHEKLGVERDDLLKERRQWRTHAMDVPDKEHDDDGVENQYEGAVAIATGNMLVEEATNTANDTESSSQEIMQLKNQIQSLQARLAAEERCHRQQLDEQSAMTRMAAGALATAMQRLRRLQGFALDLQCVTSATQKENN
jgi:hypothetical protein